MKKSLGIFITTTFIAAVLLALNILLYQMPDLKGETDSFIYSLPVLYLFFYIFTVVILAVLIVISKKRKEQLGYVFLFLTAAKMGFSYLFARPILTKTIADPTEKMNFFIVFILFLVIEAYYTARLLNNK